MVTLFIWQYAVDPTTAETRLYVFGTFWLYIFEAAWIIYGSTFIYSEEIRECDATTFLAFGATIVRVWELRITATVLIILGYLHLAGIIFLFCFACCIFCVYKKLCEED